MLKEVAGFVGSVRQRGTYATLRLVASELAFDIWAGTETRRVLEANQLGATADGVESHGLVYHAVNPHVFACALAAVRRQQGGRNWEGSFVDFGSGKGRGLILAAQHGFETVVGVECSRVLHDLAKRNLQQAWRRCRIQARYELHCQNAAVFPVPDDSAVWFWFNPFGIETVERVAESLVASIRRRPRNAHLLYANAIHASVLRRMGFHVAAEVRAGGRHVDALILSPPG